MGLTAEKYERLQAMLTEDEQSGGKRLSASVRSAAQDAVKAYESADMGGVQVTGAVPPQRQAVAHPDESLVRRLTPEHPLPPQALSVQPATAHPKGDKAAADEWIRGDIDNPGGLVIVYDAPVAQARKELIENPELLGAIGFGDRMSPDLTHMESGDAIHQAYNDYKWRQYADTAVKGGKTPYRYSKAPWLRDGKGAGVLSTLSTKLKTSALPALETATGVIMGLDDANFGIGRAIADAGLLDDEKLSPEERKRNLSALGIEPGEPFPGRKTVVPGASPLGGGNNEMVGGITQAAKDSSTAEMLDMVSEENAGARTAGQVYGAMPGLAGAAVRGAAGLAGKAATKAAAPVAKGLDTLADWMPANKLWGAVVGAGNKLKAPALLTGPASAAIAGTAHQAVSEVARAGANLLGTGETGTTARDAADRMGDATLSALGWGLPGAVLGAASRGHANWVRTGKRYEQLPDRLENLGVKFELGKGPIEPPVVTRAREMARQPDIKPIDVLAEQAAEPLTRAAKLHEQGAKVRAKDIQSEVYRSPEGKQPLPAQNLVSTAVDLLDQRTASIRGRAPTAVGIPNAPNRVRGILNANIDGISLEPVEGAIPLTVKKAEAYLSSRWLARATKAAKTGSAVASRGRGLARVPPPSPRAATPEAPGGPMQRVPPLRTGRPQLEGERGLARTEARRPPPGALPEGRGELSTSVDDFPHMRDPRDFPPNEAPRDIGERAPKPRKGARWPRRQPEVVEGEPVPRAAASKARVTRGAKAGAKAAAAPKATKEVSPDFAEAMRARGVKKVYVLPRRYNAQHHESAVQLLRRRSDESAADRDLKKLYQAALQDRDARPWKGVPGGWSAVQQRIERDIASAKDVKRRVAPNSPGGTYGQFVRTAKQREGQSRNLTAMDQMAARAGVTEQLRGARSLDPLEQLQQRISWGKNARGDRLSPLSITGAFDAGNIRLAYPITRALGGRKGVTPGPIGGGQTGRLALIGEDDDIEARRRARDEERVRDAPARGEGGPKKRRRRVVKKRRRRTE